MIPGIIGDCGGCCTCATCHGYVDKSWQAKLSPKSEDEIMMIDGVIAARDESRLTCQIIVQLELDGLVVRLPESQF
jgi:2Fe-2S ferredoxin